MMSYLFMGFKEELGLKGLKGSIELIQDEGLLKEELWLIKEDDKAVLDKEVEEVEDVEFIESKRERCLIEEDIPWWSIVSEEDILCVSEKRPAPLDLKKGKPFRGESLAIKYDLVSAWNTKINITNKPVIKDGCKGKDNLGNNRGIINSKLLKLKKATTKEKSIQYRTFRISFEDKTKPSFRVNSFCFKSSVKSSLNVPIKGLVLTTTILAMTDKIKNEMKDIIILGRAGILSRKTNPEINSGASHNNKMESLFFVQYALRNIEITCLNLFYVFIHYCNIARCLSQEFYDLKTGSQVHHQPQLFLLFQPIRSSNLFRRLPYAEL